MDVSHNLIGAANGVTVLQFDDIRPPIIEIAGVDHQPHTGFWHQMADGTVFGGAQNSHRVYQHSTYD